MRTLGIKISSKIDNSYPNSPVDHWEGYWCYTTKDESIYESTGISRKSKYDAEQDAIRAAIEYSRKNRIIFITEGYIL